MEVLIVIFLYEYYNDEVFICLIKCSIIFVNLNYENIYLYKLNYFRALKIRMYKQTGLL